MDRFDKFTERARRVLTLAQEEAQRFNHNYIGTEHLLLGLVREGEGIAAGVLESLGVNLERVRAELARVGPIVDDAKKAAATLGSGYIREPDLPFRGWWIPETAKWPPIPTPGNLLTYIATRQVWRGGEPRAVTGSPPPKASIPCTRGEAT